MVTDCQIPNWTIEIPAEEINVGMVASGATRMQSFKLDNRLELWNFTVSSSGLLSARIISTLEIS